MNVWYVNNDDDDGVTCVIFNTFAVMTSKIKIVLDTPGEPSFKMEVITEIIMGPYTDKKMADHDVVLGKERILSAFRLSNRCRYYYLFCESLECSNKTL